MLPAGPPQKRRSLRGRKEPGEKRLDIPATSHQIHIVALQSLVPLVEPGHLAARLVQVQNQLGKVVGLIDVGLPLSGQTVLQPPAIQHPSKGLGIGDCQSDTPAAGSLQFLGADLPDQSSLV